MLFLRTLRPSHDSHIFRQSQLGSLRASSGAVSLVPTHGGGRYGRTLSISIGLLSRINNLISPRLPAPPSPLSTNDHHLLDTRLPLARCPTLKSGTTAGRSGLSLVSKTIRILIYLRLRSELLFYFQAPMTTLRRLILHPPQPLLWS